jgi:hypothetical protein
MVTDAKAFLITSIYLIHLVHLKNIEIYVISTIHEPIMLDVYELIQTLENYAD